MVVIGREETAEAVREFRSKHGYTFPMAPDPERAAYSQYAHQLIPRTYVIGPDGKLSFASGGADEEDLKVLKAEVARQVAATP